jgi:hypothetical protein
MPTNYNSNITSTNIPAKSGSSIPRVISDVVDFSSTTNATGDTFDVLPIPANSLVLAAGVDVLTADGAGNSGTIAVGDSVDADQYAAAATVAAGGQMTTLDANYAYSAADAIRLTIGTGAIDAKVRVWCCVMSLDAGGTLTDSDSQTSTFA